MTSNSCCAVRPRCHVPLVASGGAGTVAHFVAVFTKANVQGALAASVFHEGLIGIADLKDELRLAGVPVRPTRAPPVRVPASRRTLTLDASEVSPPAGQRRGLEPGDVERLDFAKGEGLIPAIVQHAASGAVLMLGYMNQEALRASLTRRRVVFFSRARQQLWEKGETSGHTLRLEQIRTDCDADALLVSAWPQGPACHRGTDTCFDASAGGGGGLAFLGELSQVIAARRGADPAQSYTARLLAGGARRVAQKVGEEGLEVALAAASGTDREVVAESADLLYHLLVLLNLRGVALAEVVRELQARHADHGPGPGPP